MTTITSSMLCEVFLSILCTAYLPNSDVLELRGQGEHSKELDLAEGWLEKLVVLLLAEGRRLGDL